MTADRRIFLAALDRLHHPDPGGHRPPLQWDAFRLCYAIIPEEVPPHFQQVNQFQPAPTYAGVPHLKQTTTN